ncbi:MAG: hypothetical protein ABH883_02990, partial [Candidatus Omnitrophota bacterium]
FITKFYSLRLAAGKKQDKIIQSLFDLMARTLRDEEYGATEPESILLDQLRELPEGCEGYQIFGACLIYAGIRAADMAFISFMEQYLAPMGAEGKDENAESFFSIARHMIIEKLCTTFIAAYKNFEPEQILALKDAEFDNIIASDVAASAYWRILTQVLRMEKIIIIEHMRALLLSISGYIPEPSTGAGKSDMPDVPVSPGNADEKNMKGKKPLTTMPQVQFPDIIHTMSVLMAACAKDLSLNNGNKNAFTELNSKLDIWFQQYNADNDAFITELEKIYRFIFNLGTQYGPPYTAILHFMRKLTESSNKFQPWVIALNLMYTSSIYSDSEFLGYMADVMVFLENTPESGAWRAVFGAIVKKRLLTRLEKLLLILWQRKYGSRAKSESLTPEKIGTILFWEETPEQAIAIKYAEMFLRLMNIDPNSDAGTTYMNNFIRELAETQQNGKQPRNGVVNVGNIDDDVVDPEIVRLISRGKAAELIFEGADYDELCEYAIIENKDDKLNDTLSRESIVSEFISDGMIRKNLEYALREAGISREGFRIGLLSVDLGAIFTGENETLSDAAIVHSGGRKWMARDLAFSLLMKPEDEDGGNLLVDVLKHEKKHEDPGYRHENDSDYPRLAARVEKRWKEVLLNRMKTLARAIPYEYSQNPENKPAYTFIVPKRFFKNMSEEHKYDTTAYSRLFNIEVYDGTEEELRAKLAGVDADKVMAVLPEDIDGAAIQESFRKTRFIRLNVDETYTADFNKTNERERQEYRRDIYSIMYLSWNAEKEGNAAYTLLKYLVRTHFSYEDPARPEVIKFENYIESLIAESPEKRLYCLKKQLAYCPVGKYTLPEYRQVAEMLIYA